MRTMYVYALKSKCVLKHAVHIDIHVLNDWCQEYNGNPNQHNSKCLEGYMYGWCSVWFCSRSGSRIVWAGAWNRYVCCCLFYDSFIVVGEFILSKLE